MISWFDERKWVVIGNHPFVDFSVVHDWKKRSIKLLDKKKEDVMGDCPFYYTSDWRFSSMNS